MNFSKGDRCSRGPVPSAAQGDGIAPLKVEDMWPSCFSDGPSDDPVAASFNLQFAAAAITGIVGVYVQKVHSLNSQFREQNAAIREFPDGQRFPSNEPMKAIDKSLHRLSTK